jgi:hypothetical protein
MPLKAFDKLLTTWKSFSMETIALVILEFHMKLFRSYHTWSFPSFKTVIQVFCHPPITQSHMTIQQDFNIFLSLAFISQIFCGNTTIMGLNDFALELVLLYFHY